MKNIIIKSFYVVVAILFPIYLEAGCRSCEYQSYKSERPTPRFIRTSMDKKSQAQFIGNDMSGTSNPGWNYSNINR